FGYFFALFLVRVNQHNHEFVSSVAECIVARTNRTPEYARHLYEQSRADPVATRIVHAFKIVDVEKKNAEFFLHALHARNLAFEYERQIALVVERREIIKICFVPSTPELPAEFNMSGRLLAKCFQMLEL